MMDLEAQKLDSISATSIAAEKAGMSYGKYVALYGVVRVGEKEAVLPMHSQICQECGEPFSDRKGRPKYCSDECQRKAGLRRYMEQYRKRRKEEARERICVVCGKPIPVERNLQSKTCSEECARKNRAQTKRQYGKDHRVPVLAAVERICPICGSPFTPAVHNQKYCCKECYARANYDFSRKNRKVKKEEPKNELESRSN